MATDFIGETILVTLQSPPNAQIQGIVANIADQKLYLQNVLLLWNGQRLPSHILDAALIADLEVAPSQPSQSSLPTPTVPTQPVGRRPSHNGAPHAPAPWQPTSFQDPAILSYHKPIHQPVSPIMIADGIVPSPVSPQGRGIVKQSSVSSIATSQPLKPNRRDSEATAILTEPFDALALGNVGNKKTAKKHRSTPSQTAPGIIDVKDIHAPLKTTTPAKEKKAGKGKGWRSTPLIEERPTRRQRARKAEETNNGWATEDATDIQDMPEFDFASNLSKFDKRQVFDDIRRDDHIPADERLVSFNRLARPGTNGGKNLHFSENVLDGGNGNGNNDLWKSEAGETEDDGPVEPDHYSSGRGSRRANSRRPHATSRKASILAASHAASQQQQRTASPRPLSRVATATNMNGSGRTSSLNGLPSKATFRLASNNKPIHCVSPLQMLEIEQLCTSDLGLSEEQLSENAGRSIAEALLKFSTEAKCIVFLVGNHKSGARSVAAARHLRNRRLRVTVILLGGEREDSVLESVKRQLHTYRKGGGWVEKWDEYQTKLAAASASASATSGAAAATAKGGGATKPDIIVDALLGIHTNFDELRTDDAAVAFEMTSWANRNGNTTVSIDIPSGLSASSGLLSEADDGSTLVMDAKRVVCLAAPKIGLLQAMVHAHSEGEAERELGWEVVVADVGVSAVAWQRHSSGSRRRQGVDFGGEWVVGVNFAAT